MLKHKQLDKLSVYEFAADIRNAVAKTKTTIRP